MTWRHLLDRRHPVWLIAGIAVVCAFAGADDLDAKDVLSHVVNGAAIYYGAARAKGGQ